MTRPTSSFLRAMLLACGTVLVATSALAGGAIKANLVPFIDTCYQGSCQLGESCTTNSDCTFRYMSPKSRVSLAADGRLKVQLKDVVDGSGVDANGTYIVFVFLFGVHVEKGMLLKVPVEQGSGQIDINVGSFMGSPGELISLSSVNVMGPPTEPANCPYNGNTAHEIEMRGLDPDCFSGVDLGVMGLVSAGKSSIKTFLPPVNDFCDEGRCSSNLSCTTNSDCNYGSLSPSSKVSLTGAGRLRVQLKNVLDAAGNVGAGDYYFDIGMSYYPTFDEERLFAKVAVADGKGEIHVDLSPTLSHAGESIIVEFGGIYSPVTMPAACVGAGNTVAEMEARVADPDCYAGSHRIGGMGIATEDN